MLLSMRTSSKKKYLLLIIFLVATAAGLAMSPADTEDPIDKKIPDSMIGDTPIFYGAHAKFAKSPRIRVGDVVSLEGILEKSKDYNSISIAALPYNAICFLDDVGAPEGSIIQGSFRILRLQEGACSDAQLLSFSVLYDVAEIQRSLSGFSNYCSLVENDINTKKLTTYPVSTDCSFDVYRWIPLRSELLAQIRYKSENRNDGPCFESSYAYADLLIRPETGKLTKIYINPDERRVCQ